MTPFFSINDQTAERSFRHAKQSPESIMHTHPEDYSLYRIGEFDDFSGDVVGETPHHICNA